MGYKLGGGNAIVSYAALNALTLDTSAFLDDVAAGSVISVISGKSAGSTLSITPNDGRLVLSGDQTQVLRGLSAVTPSSTIYTITETKVGAPNSPRANAFTFVITAAGPAIQYVNFGSAAVGSFDVTSGNPLLAMQGTVGQRGWGKRAKGAWSTMMYDLIATDDVYYAGVDAYHASPLSILNTGDYFGIKHVTFIMSGGTPLVVTERTVHPVSGILAYHCPIRRSDATASRQHELIAVVTPHVGLPFVLQGTPDMKTQYKAFSGSNIFRLNWLNDMWSMKINVDKTGSALPKCVVWKTSNTGTGNDANTGLTEAQALKS